MNIKSLILGILLILLVGIGGFVYRNAVEHPSQSIACPLDAKVCPDGSALARISTSCTFPACPPPNVSLDAVGLAFALPVGYAPSALPDATAIAAYDNSPTGTSTLPARIVIRRYPIAASSTALVTIQATAIGTSGAPVSVTSYTNANIGQHHFTVVAIERFEGVVDTAYYLAREGNVLRFDAIDSSVRLDPGLDVTKLPAATALRAILTTLQGE